jgi:hypothetical protein
MRKFFGFTQAESTQYAGKWISIPSSNPAYSSLTADATFASFLVDLLPREHLKLLRATIGGRSSVGVRGDVLQGGTKLVETVYAPARGTPLPFKATATSPGIAGTTSSRLSRWNEPVHLTAPANAVPISTVVGH